MLHVTSVYTPCCMLHVLACCLELLCSSKPVKLLATCTEMDATTLYIVGRQCWESLRLFACSLKGTDHHKQVLSACLAMTKLSVAICSENLMNLQRCPGLKLNWEIPVSVQAAIRFITLGCSPTVAIISSSFLRSRFSFSVAFSTILKMLSLLLWVRYYITFLMPMKIISRYIC